MFYLFSCSAYEGAQKRICGPVAGCPSLGLINEAAGEGALEEEEGAEAGQGRAESAVKKDDGDAHEDAV